MVVEIVTIIVFKTLREILNAVLLYMPLQVLQGALGQVWGNSLIIWHSSVHDTTYQNP